MMFDAVTCTQYHPASRLSSLGDSLRVELSQGVTDGSAASRRHHMTECTVPAGKHYQPC